MFARERVVCYETLNEATFASGSKSFGLSALSMFQDGCFTHDTGQIRQQLS